MSDLISRSALIEAVVNRTGSPTVLFNTTEELNAYLEGCAFKQNDILNIIEDMPTAYDVEKAVEDLENHKQKYVALFEDGQYKDSHFFKGKIDAFDVAKNIVKKQVK